MIIRNFELRDLDEVIRMENENFPDPWPRESFLYDKDNEVASFKVLEKQNQFTALRDNNFVVPPKTQEAIIFSSPFKAEILDKEIT